MATIKEIRRIKEVREWLTLSFTVIGVLAVPALGYWMKLEISDAVKTVKIEMVQSYVDKADFTAAMLAINAELREVSGREQKDKAEVDLRMQRLFDVNGLHAFQRYGMTNRENIDQGL